LQKKKKGERPKGRKEIGGKEGGLACNKTRKKSWGKVEVTS